MHEIKRATPVLINIIKVHTGMQSHTSRQSCCLVIEGLPLPSFSLLKKLSVGVIAPMKAIKLLLDKGNIIVDVILIIDEMYLQGLCEYSSGIFFGRDVNGEFYNGSMVFTVVSLKTSIPFIIKSCPKTWLFSQITESIESVSHSGFVRRAVVSEFLTILSNSLPILSFPRGKTLGPFLKLPLAPTTTRKG